MFNNRTIAETHHLSIGYQLTGKSLCLFEDLNLTLEAGELVCFMGPNGIGKSSLLRTLAGLQKPLTGKITLPSGLSLALVLTDKITASQMSVYDLISFGRYPYMSWNISLSSNDYRAIDKAIGLTRVETLVDKKLFELSDGQLQMALIAKALAQETPILILDEPTAHLDLNNRVEIMNTLRALSHNENRTILLATHELDLALQTADKVWLATHDKKIKVGIPEDLVLDGSFDQVFQFKGFDLKTGKVQHDAHRNVSVELIGSGHELLWTRNALERSGFKIETSTIKITIQSSDTSISWRVSSPVNMDTFNSIGKLLMHLDSLTQ